MAIATIGRVLGKAGLAYLKKNKSKIKKELDSPESKQKVQEIMNKVKKGLGKKMLTGGQAKIAAKAPPTNKIDEKDFAVLRAEKAKGRGMGLQDEKVQPGKVMKAKRGQFSKSNISGHKRIMGVFPKVSSGTGKAMGEAKDYKNYLKGLKEATKSKSAQRAGEIAKKAAKSTTIGKIALGVAGAGIAAKKFIESDKFKDMLKKKMNKKMGGGMMKKYSKGGGADTGTMGERKSRLGVALNKVKRLSRTLRDTDRLTERDIDNAKRSIQSAKAKRAAQGFLPSDPMPKKMGGGMIGASQMPGYSTGKSITVKTKLGRNKPTKMY